MSDSIQTILVRTAPGYTVSIGPGLLTSCGQRLREVLGPCRAAVIADSTVAPLYAPAVTASLSAAGFSVCSYQFPAGEAHKNFSTLSEILEFLAREHLTRSDCVVALGGGVAGDMAGFAAAVYLRGIRCVQLPTTLLAAVDSSVGGKTAIDLASGKNLAGAFLQPAAVLCDTDCLKSLPPDVFADGAAEAIKTGVLCDESLFALFEDGTLTADPAEVIARCVAYKAGGGAGRKGTGRATPFKSWPYRGPRHRNVQRLRHPPRPRRGGGPCDHRPGSGGPGLDKAAHRRPDRRVSCEKRPPHRYGLHR